MTDSSIRPRASDRPFSAPRALLYLCLLAALAAPGCKGCWGNVTPLAEKSKKDLDEEELFKQKKLEKPKDDFEPIVLRMLPSNDPSPEDKVPNISVKAGHWTAVQETAKANNFDFPGELATYIEEPVISQPAVVEDTTSRLSILCPAVLPKGQPKRIDSMFYVQRRDPELGSVYALRTDLRGAHAGRSELAMTTLCPSLKDYEHLIVVLTSAEVTPGAYTHFDRLHSVSLPKTDLIEEDHVQHYRVVRPTCDRRSGAPLPGHALAWTTIAYVFWDDLEPDALTANQQQALLDWLHWGGQLVLSGPSTIDKLKGSFLTPYLPGEVTQAVKLNESDFEELNDTFSLRRVTQDAAGKRDSLSRIAVAEEAPMIGVALKLHAAGRYIAGTGELVAERRVGGGRIAVTRFPLTDVRIKQWKNFDGFFNSVLLRRPARVFSQGEIGGLTFQWAIPQLRRMRLEPRIGSTLRYFSRDVGMFVGEEPPKRIELTVTELAAGGRRRPGGGGINSGSVFTAPGMPLGPGFGMDNDFSRERPKTFADDPDLDDWHFCGYHSSPLAGVAAWHDWGAAAHAARQALTEAAGIQIPRASFVAQVLGVYLLVLVPVNWLIFWSIGRVEWAWIAAPLIAVVGAGAVIRLAQLDIGFARSRTEIGILEVQGGYERAHLTRFTALYTSLSSTYDLTFAEPSALALPFPATQQSESLLTISNYSNVVFRRDKETALRGVQVSSNSTGMVHSEQMLTLGANPKVTESLQLIGDDSTGFSIRNTTDLTLRDVGVFRRVDLPMSGLTPTAVQIETAYVARIEPATSAPVRFIPLAEDEAETEQPRITNSKSTAYRAPWLPEWSESTVFGEPTAAGIGEKGRVSLRRLGKLAAQRLRLLPGDVRLVAWTDERLPGMEIAPEAPQNTAYTLILAHLARGALPAPTSDSNVAADFIDATIIPEPEPAVSPLNP